MIRRRVLVVVVGVPAALVSGFLGAGCEPAVAGPLDTAPAVTGPTAHAATAAAAAGGDPIERQIGDLENEEVALRAATDWARFPASDRTLGPDPVDVIALPDGRYVGALRGADAVVLLDAQGRELDRAAAPRAPRTLTVASDGFAVAGEAPPRAQRFVVDKDRLAPQAQAAADERVAPFVRTTAGGWSARLDVLGHAVHVSKDGRAVAALSADGPPLGVALRPAGADLLVAVGLIEDHPLDRSIGSFGHIDSFLRVFRVDGGGGAGGGEHAARRLLELNLSELGVVTPKALAFVDDDTVLVAGSGSGRAAQIRVSSGAGALVPSLPGVVALVPTKSGAKTGFIGASPLLDAWVISDGQGAHAVPVPATNDGSRRSVDSRLGEALVFTTIMAPRQKSDGPLSRFTCEACHFEGGADGRTHHTGREDIRATTRPLMGLFNNKPLFTRALDPNLSRMAHAEFRVANANTSLDPWFDLTLADAPWLSLLGVERIRRAADLRRALVTFLHDFTPRSNPRVVERLARDGANATFTALERKGAEVFRARCASCHAARLVGDDPSTTQPFERWEHLVLSDNGPLVWSSPERRKTGVVPYVHADGARSSSLRRLEQKRPYFTNGSAETLADVVGAFVLPDRHAAPQGHKLSADDQRALLAFLVLL